MAGARRLEPGEGGKGDLEDTEVGLLELEAAGGSGENMVVWVSSGEQRLYWPGLPGTTQSEENRMWYVRPETVLLPGG